VALNVIETLCIWRPLATRGIKFDRCSNLLGHKRQVSYKYMRHSVMECVSALALPSICFYHESPYGQDAL
jgi:hypothetical protein